MEEGIAEIHQIDDEIETDCPIDKLVFDAESRLNQLEQRVKQHKAAYDGVMNQKKKWENYLKQLRIASNMHPDNEQSLKKRKYEDEQVVPTQVCCISEI